jgi:hypothetical protein
MIKPITAFTIVVASFLSGCEGTSVSRHDISNGPVALLSFADTAQQENLVSQQANALNDLSHDILRASKIKGMKVGAAVGWPLFPQEMHGAALWVHWQEVPQVQLPDVRQANVRSRNGWNWLIQIS